MSEAPANDDEVVPLFYREVTARETAWGRVSVVHDTVQRAHILVNNHTWHGWQFLDPQRLDEPTSYYTEGSPAWALVATAPPRARIAVAGLGAGVMASLAAPGHTMVFYELDDAVIELARDPQWFSFLTRSRGHCEVRRGDVLERLADPTEGLFDLVAVDAFFGHAVSDEVLDARAFALFLERTTTHGVVAFHITSTAAGLDHRPWLASLADGLPCAWCDHTSARLDHDPDLAIDERFDLSMPVESRWMAVSRSADALAPLVTRHGWTRW